MNDLAGNNSFVFIIGSPRSGTTILGDILDKHENISQWHEPYFIWDRYFRRFPHDERTAEDASLKIRKYIKKEFLRYKKKTGSTIIVDKSPRNSLKIPFIRKIFPQARFIHLIRDGRDVTLSINKEWIRLQNIVKDPKTNNFNYQSAFKVLMGWLDKQRFLKDKLMAFWFETHGHIINRSRHLNRLRWHGDVGWGARFKGWEGVIGQTSILQFNAYQWLKCIESIQKHWVEIPETNKLEVRYEELINEEEKIITRILDFLGLRPQKGFFVTIPKLIKNNYNKWQSEFTKSELDEINSILSPMLIELGYQ